MDSSYEMEANYPHFKTLAIRVSLFTWVTTTNCSIPLC